MGWKNKRAALELCSDAKLTSSMLLCQDQIFPLKFPQCTQFKELNFKIHISSSSKWNCQQMVCGNWAVQHPDERQCTQCWIVAGITTAHKRAIHWSIMYRDYGIWKLKHVCFHGRNRRIQKISSTHLFWLSNTTCRSGPNKSSEVKLIS